MAFSLYCLQLRTRFKRYYGRYLLDCEITLRNASDAIFSEADHILCLEYINMNIVAKTKKNFKRQRHMTLSTGPGCSHAIVENLLSITVNLGSFINRTTRNQRDRENTLYEIVLCNLLQNLTQNLSRNRMQIHITIDKQNPAPSSILKLRYNIFSNLYSIWNSIGTDYLYNRRLFGRG